MIDKEEKPFFSFVCKTEEDIKLEINKQISELVESQQSEFKFNNETLYKLGNGHSFCYGFFTEYLTKTGVVQDIMLMVGGTLMVLFILI